MIDFLIDLYSISISYSPLLAGNLSNLKSPKSSDYLKFLKSLGLLDKKTLVVLGEQNNNVYLSSRNLSNSKVVINSELSTYEITNASSLVLFESAVPNLESTLSKS